MLNIQAVTKSYDGKSKAVNQLSLKVAPGEICGLLGPNGAGKTTTLKMVTGILEPTEGMITINNHDIQADPVAAKMSFAFVPDDPNVFVRFKGIEYLKFIGDIYRVPVETRIKRVEELAEKFEMSDALGDKIQSYSHGMRQKIVLIGALLHNPPLWILDEPMTGLDPKSAFILKNMMREHANQGNAVLFSTHVLEVAEKVCDTIAIIDKGELKFYGTIAAMREHFKANTSLESMFLELTEGELNT
ncbi:ABC transporter ATP-binding protein [Mageeibacillus indolicus]|jgi:hypothetical protein|uniref:ABC transporter, ATP-binding protein n=2 Tax=Mageeibacillus indolicus TaxID=884684 RepID=D3QZ08_MAGIU|nr:ABC transporter ATP-binding protein [Mageeibacillus indolicus]ADC91649.1 ABC transporter, ATP-binding protein [Mageeibacillus indolicus UPII9-5]KFA56917.1 3-dehydroquinate dehydratase [Mageeibacillus indolicus 0009-5]PNH18007.1 3-dehydroquinate dehydratase [Mageeibacillus indolicus]